MRSISGRLIIGLFILVVGILLLLNNLNIGVNIDIRQIMRLWPVIPLVLGLSWLVSSFGSSETEEGFFLGPVCYRRNIYCYRSNLSRAEPGPF